MLRSLISNIVLRPFQKKLKRRNQQVTGVAFVIFRWHGETMGPPTSSPSVVRGRNNNNNTIFSWPGKLGPGASPSKNGITKNGQGARFVGEFFFLFWTWILGQSSSLRRYQQVYTYTGDAIIVRSIWTKKVPKNVEISGSLQM